MSFNMNRPMKKTLNVQRRTDGMFEIPFELVDLICIDDLPPDLTIVLVSSASLHSCGVTTDIISDRMLVEKPPELHLPLPDKEVKIKERDFTLKRDISGILPDLLWDAIVTSKELKWITDHMEKIIKARSLQSLMTDLSLQPFYVTKEEVNKYDFKLSPSMLVQLETVGKAYYLTRHKNSELKHLINLTRELRWARNVQADKSPFGLPRTSWYEQNIGSNFEDADYVNTMIVLIQHPDFNKNQSIHRDKCEEFRRKRTLEVFDLKFYTVELRRIETLPSQITVQEKIGLYPGYSQYLAQLANYPIRQLKKQLNKRRAVSNRTKEITKFLQYFKKLKIRPLLLNLTD